MNAGMILMICGGAFTVIGLIMAVAEAILEPKRKQNIRKTGRQNNYLFTDRCCRKHAIDRHLKYLSDLLST